MTQSIVAKRYAQALFELAKEQGQLAEVGADLQQIVKVAELSPDFLAAETNLYLPTSLDLLQLSIKSNFNFVAQ